MPDKTTGENAGGPLRLPMRTRWAAQLLISAVILAGLLVAVFKWEDEPDAREPEYGGKKLSEWLESTYGHVYLPNDVSRPVFDSSGSSIWFQTNDAVYQMGTNAIPYLLDWMRYETPFWKPKFNGLVNPVLRRLKGSWQLTDEPKRARALCATYCLLALGSTAEVAIPELTIMVNDRKAKKCAMRASVVLSHLRYRRNGLVCLPAVLALMTNGSTELRLESIAAFGSLGNNAIRAVPALHQCLQETNVALKTAAACALGSLTKEPRMVVPLLANSLDCPVGRWAVIDALARFGSEARSSSPALLSLLKAPDRMSRDAATNALRTIDPDALQKAARTAE